MGEELREAIINHHKNGKSSYEIAKFLLLSRSSVQSIISSFKKTGSILPKVHPGRKSQITAADLRVLRRIIVSNRRSTGVEIATLFSDAIQKKVSSRNCLKLMKKLEFSFYKVRPSIYASSMKCR